MSGGPASAGNVLSPRQQVYRSHAVGDQQGGGIAGMEPGFLIRGVVVDNPSGSWIRLKPTLQYVKPYTFGWASTLIPGQQVLVAEYVDGPVGQPSSTAGEPIVVYLYDIQVPNNAGTTFVETTPDTDLLSGSITALVAGASVSTTLITPPTGRRVRFLGAAVVYNFSTNPVNLDCPVKVGFSRVSDSFVIIQLGIAPNQPSDASGDFLYDLPIDDPLQITPTGLWAKVSLTYAIRYQII